MNRSIVASIWVGGAVLALLLYAVGPFDVMQGLWLAIDRVQYVLGHSVAVLLRQSFGLIHAVALALFAVFLVLAALGGQRGVRGGGVAGVSALFVGLIVVGGYGSRLCWLAALLVALAGALHMTQRLTGGPARTPWTGGERRRRA